MRLAFGGALILLAACGGDPAARDLPPLGDFRLGYAIAQADEATKGPFSRDAGAEELEDAVEAAIVARLDGYDGDGLYHLGVYIGAYVLAQPGLPVVYTPKSALVMDVTLFDNATGKMAEEPHRIVAFEGLRNTRPLLGSGLTRDKEEQLRNLAQETARHVSDWLAENESWFEPDPRRPRVPFDRALRDAAGAVEDARAGAAGATAAAADEPGA